jgi:hypothetical protein
MANQTGIGAASATLTGSTPDVVTLTGSTQVVQVVNRSAVGMWVKLGAVDPGAFAAAAAEALYVLPNSALSVRTGGWQQTVVRVLGDGAGGNGYTIQAMARL